MDTSKGLKMTSKGAAATNQSFLGKRGGETPHTTKGSYPQRNHYQKNNQQGWNQNWHNYGSSHRCKTTIAKLRAEISKQGTKNVKSTVSTMNDYYLENTLENFHGGKTNFDAIIKLCF